MKMNNDLHQLDVRLGRIEAKLDNHLERVAKAEEAIVHVRGYIKLILSAITAIISTGVMVIIQILSKGPTN